MNPSVYDIAMASCTALIALVMFVQSYRVSFCIKARWRGKFLAYYSHKRSLLTRFLAILGVLALISAVGDLLYSSIINGIVYVAIAVVILVMIPKLHAEPEPMGFVVRNKEKFHSELMWSSKLAALFVAGAILNLLFGIHV